MPKNVNNEFSRLENELRQVGATHRGLIAQDETLLEIVSYPGDIFLLKDDYTTVGIIKPDYSNQTSMSAYFNSDIVFDPGYQNKMGLVYELAGNDSSGHELSRQLHNSKMSHLEISMKSRYEDSSKLILYG